MTYATACYDMDGVILRTNGLKSAAFYHAALPFGVHAAEAMVALHQSAGSISRRERVERFYLGVLGKEPTQPEADAMLTAIGTILADGYEAAPYIEGVLEHIEHQVSDGMRAVVVTGVEQPEARRILEGRSIRRLFNGVYGGPPVKSVRLAELIHGGEIELPAVYYGDTLDDYQSARVNGLDFVLVTTDAEWDWRAFLNTSPEGVVGAIEDFEAAEVLV